MRKFVGITIGPIGDTIGEASSPAALWFASSLFSNLTERICAELSGANGFADVCIYSPYYAADIPKGDGIGKFHDRIFFSTTEEDLSRLGELLTRAKRSMVLNFPEEFQSTDTEDYLENYLQIHYVVKSENDIQDKNSILELSHYLDELELMKTFPADDVHNPFRKLFLGEDKNGNKYIKNSLLFKAVVSEKNQLKSPVGTIWSIDEVASSRKKIMEDVKRKDYYAIVSADGDGVGKFLGQLSDDMVTEFSKACLSYDEKAAMLIGKYGGMTIYAGGDDLLFLAPVMNEKQETIFELCSRINSLFRQEIQEVPAFAELESIPTVSFGIAIQYEKFPLYEALSRAGELLWKVKSGSEKNAMRIDVQKHSGQSVCLQAGNESIPSLQQILMVGNEKKDTDEVIQSVLYTIETFKPLLTTLDKEVVHGAVDKAAYTQAWKNLFDNAGQQNAQAYITEISSLYYDGLLKGKERISCEDEDAEDKAQALAGILRLKKFLLEKGGEEA